MKFDGNIETIWERDARIEELWKAFEDVPMNPETEEIEEDFLHFERGTERIVIWKWFDKRHSKGVHYLLYGTGKDTLLEFIKQEVPFRLESVLNLPDGSITEEVIDACVDKLNYESDIMFDYDRIDSALLDVCREFGIEQEE